MLKLVPVLKEKTGPGRFRKHMKGTVKKFFKDKGFGFIHAEDGKDYFFHYSAIQMDNYKTAEIGENVEFEPVEGDRGLRANNVKKVD